MPFYKNIWFWIDLFLIILCAAFYLLANLNFVEIWRLQNPKFRLYALVLTLSSRQTTYRQV